MKISKEISIEELIEEVPASVKYLMNEGIRCIVCGEPIWGTLEEAAEEKGFGEKDIEKFVKELQVIADTDEGNTDSGINKIDVKRIN
jgi:methionine synthase II (cobalamin-independent)